MTKIIFLFIVIIFTSMSYSQEISERNASVLFNINSNTKTKIEVLDCDSLIINTIFDNIIDRSTKLHLVKQPTFFNLSKMNKNDIYIPMPILSDGKYFIKFSSKDTIYTIKLLYINEPK